MVMQVIVNLHGAIRKDADADVFVSFCPALKLYSQGETEEQATDALKSAVTLFLEHCIEHGHIDAALKSVGMTRTSASALSSVESSVKEWIAIQEAKFDDAFPFSVPINLLAGQKQERPACV